MNPGDVTALIGAVPSGAARRRSGGGGGGCKQIADAVGDLRVKGGVPGVGGAPLRRRRAARGGAGGGGARRGARARLAVGALPARAPVRRRRQRCARSPRSSSASCATAVWRRPQAGSTSATSIATGSATLDRAEKAFARGRSTALMGRRAPPRSPSCRIWRRCAATGAASSSSTSTRRGESDAGARADILTRIGEVREREIDDSDGAGEAYALRDPGRRQLHAGARGRGPRLQQARHHRQAGVDASRGGGERAIAGRARVGAVARGRASGRARGDARRGHRRSDGGARRGTDGARSLRRARAGAATQGRVRAAVRALSQRDRSRRRAAIVRPGCRRRSANWRRCGWAITRRAIEAFSIAAGIEGGRARATRCRGWRSCSRTARRRHPSSTPCWRASPRSPTARPSRRRSSSTRRGCRRSAGTSKLRWPAIAARVELAPLGSHRVHGGRARVSPRRALGRAVGAVRARARTRRRRRARAQRLQARARCWRGKLGRVDEGIKYLQQTLTLAPRHLPARLLLAALYTEAQRWEELAPVLARAAADADAVGAPRGARRGGRAARRGAGLWEAAALAGVSLTAPARARLYARLGRWNELAELHERVRPTARAQARRRLRAIGPPSCGSNGSASRRARRRAARRRARRRARSGWRSCWRTSARSATTGRRGARRSRSWWRARAIRRCGSRSCGGSPRRNRRTRWWRRG